MSEKTPRVWEVQSYGAERGRRAILSDPSAPGPDIVVDSPAWFAWLEAPTTTSFSYPLFDPAAGYILGFMTVRGCPLGLAAEAWHELLVGISAVSGACAESVPRTLGHDHRCSAQRDCDQLAPHRRTDDIDDGARTWLRWQIIMLNFRL